MMLGQQWTIYQTETFRILYSIVYQGKIIPERAHVVSVKSRLIKMNQLNLSIFT
jgi:hypothetical protein